MSGRPPRSGIRLAVGVVAGLWAVAVAVQLLLALQNARTGVEAATTARESLRAGRFDGRLVAQLERAHDAFRIGHRRAAGPLVAPLRLLPIAGRQLQSFADLTDHAGNVSRIGAASAALAQELLDGPEPVGGRAVTVRQLAALATGAERALGGVRLHRSPSLVTPLARRWEQLERQLGEARDGIRTASVVAATMADFLSGPRRYLLLAANNAEMRAGSGMFLSAGLLQTDGGTLTMGPVRPTAELALPGEGVPLEGDLAERWGWLRPGREWRNLATSPRFDVTGALAGRMWEGLTGERVDGVLALDVEFVRVLLEATGPVSVGSALVDKDNVVETLMHGQYAGLSYADEQSARREQLGQIAATTLAALQDRRLDMGGLIQGFAGAARGRHILAWSADPREQEAWAKAGITGELTASSLAVSVLNRGGNKLDRFLEVDNGLDVRSTADVTDVTVDVRLHNSVPSGESAYVAGPHPDSGAGEGEYVGVLAVNLPQAATNIVIDGKPRLVAAGPDGRTVVVASPFQLPRGAERRIVVRFRLPSPAGRLVLSPSARVPPVSWRVGDSERDDDRPRVVEWDAGGLLPHPARQE